MADDTLRRDLAEARAALRAIGEVLPIPWAVTPPGQWQELIFGDGCDDLKVMPVTMEAAEGDQLCTLVNREIGRAQGEP